MRKAKKTVKRRPVKSQLWVGRDYGSDYEFVLFRTPPKSSGDFCSKGVFIGSVCAQAFHRATDFRLKDSQIAPIKIEVKLLGKIISDDGAD